MIFVFAWLTSLSMIVSRPIYVSENGIVSFSLMTEYYSIVRMYCSFFTHSSVNGRRLIPCLGTVNSDAHTLRHIQILIPQWGLLWQDAFHSAFHPPAPPSTHTPPAETQLSCVPHSVSLPFIILISICAFVILHLLGFCLYHVFSVQIESLGKMDILFSSLDSCFKK